MNAIRNSLITRIIDLGKHLQEKMEKEHVKGFAQNISIELEKPSLVKNAGTAKERDG